MKRLLYVTYAFPPAATGSAPRHIAVTKLLVENGWIPHVVTPGNPAGLPLDSSLLKLLPERVRVVRTGSGNRGRAKTPSPDGRVSPGSPLKRRLRSLVLETLLQPDRYVTWVPRAVWTALREMKRSGTELIITMGPPHSVHLTGLLCSLFTGKPWAAWFGDLWVKDGIVDWESAPAARRFWARVMEGWVVRRARGLCTTTAGSSNYFRQTYGAGCPPVHTHWNGMTREAMAARWNPDPPPALAKEMIVTYTGFFMGNQTPRYFLDGMKLFMERNPGRTVRFRIVGDMGGYGGLPDELGLEGHVEQAGKVPFTGVEEWQRSSHLLLVLLPPQPGNELKNPSKTVECVLARRPILAVAPEGDLARLVRSLNAGYTSDHTPQGVCAALETAFEDMLSGRFRVIGSPADLYGGVLDTGETGAETLRFLEGLAGSRSSTP